MTEDEHKYDDALPDRDAAREFYSKYEPKEVLGRGASSIVRRCIEKETGISFAAKIIDISNDSENKAATLEEVRILRLVLGHKYIIELHDVFESETFIFLVFELCKNGELFDYLTNVVTLSEKKTRYLMRQILEAVDHIHSCGIVHRDLKPENILLDDVLDIKITDFGFARVLKPGEMLFELCGTPNYLAPEVLKAGMYEDAEGYSYPVDMWACGVIMYTLLVGCPPFWQRKQMIMLRHIMEGKYDFNAPKWAEISDQPKDLISKLLVVDQRNRLTVRQALNHPFFQIMMWDQDVGPLKKSLSIKSRKFSIIAELAMALKKKPFNARKKFKYAIMCVQAVIRLSKLRYGPVTITVELARQDPYSNKYLRKLIDGCAFQLYGHWVKKGDDQNRGALFQNAPKLELSMISVE